jgi:carbon starvation protein
MPARRINHRTIRPAAVAGWILVSIGGAIAWGVLSLARGEHISAAWLLAAALGSYAIAYRFYARFIVTRVLRPDDRRATPAERLADGVDYEPTDRRVLFGHHFAAIAGAGPLVGPVLAAQMGYLPGTIWIVAGVIFGGAVQDLVVMFLSVRRDGASLGRMVRNEIGRVGGAAALIAVYGIMIILLAVLALIVVNALADSPWGVFSIAATIPIALFMGVYLRFLRPGKVVEASTIGAVLLLAAVAGGNWVQHSSLASVFTLTPRTLVLCLAGYGLLASILPVWLLLAPRDYLSTFVKVGAISLMAIGVLVSAPHLQAQAVTSFALSGHGPVFSGSLFPFLFITIACGALSGFHALVSSGTTPKLIEKESQVKLIGYGGMLTESFVAVMALLAASILDPGLYFAMNAPASLLGTTVQSASQAVAHLGFSISPDQLRAAAAAVGEKSLIARTGGAPTLAVGMAQVLNVFGGAALRAFWYHFAIMFEALFILTTVDAGTRVGRFMLQDLLGAAWKPLGRVNWRPGIWICSGLTVGAWGYFLYVGATDPLGGVNQLYPLFGIANQLLAAIALALATTVLVKSARLRWAWVTGVPLAWDVAVTFTASWQKIFSGDPTVGFFAERAKYARALASGRLLSPATSSGAMHTIIVNATVDGILMAVFLALVAVVVGNAAWVCVRALRSARPLPLSEAPFVESQLDLRRSGHGEPVAEAAGRAG